MLNSAPADLRVEHRIPGAVLIIGIYRHKTNTYIPVHTSKYKHTYLKYLKRRNWRFILYNINDLLSAKTALVFFSTWKEKTEDFTYRHIVNELYICFSAIQRNWVFNVVTCICTLIFIAGFINMFMMKYDESSNNHCSNHSWYPGQVRSIDSILFSFYCFKTLSYIAKQSQFTKLKIKW